MNQPTNNNLFADLPASLVDEVLYRTQEDISRELLRAFEEIRDKQTEWRQQLKDTGLLKHADNLPRVEIPTCCGVDGAYAIERLLSTDLVVAGAVAVEGLTPPSETRHWPEPRHLVYADTETHNADTGSILRGVMIGMELALARNAPHDLIFLDGSLTTPTIFFNQALSKAKELSSLKISAYLKQNIKLFLESYLAILKTTRSDRFWVAMPKYTTRREIGEQLGWPSSYDDRGLLSSILNVGEYTKPQTLIQTDWHIAIPDDIRAEITDLVKEITDWTLAKMKGGTWDVS